MKPPRCLLAVWLATSLLGCGWSNPGKAAWSGRVVAIHDGDTLTVLRRGRGVKLRLNAIDAPELDQPYGQQSRKSLSALCFGRQASVSPVGEDRYGRTLARIQCDGADVNSTQLRRGLAWHYRQYSHDPALQRDEDAARAARLGLWSQRDPAPPWEYRHGGPPAGASFLDRLNRGLRCGRKRHCDEMRSCAEAMHYLRDCGVRTLDGNHDGIPCEQLCAPQAPRR